MRLPSALTLPMIEHLNLSYFDRVWNATDDHGAVNIQLSKVATRVQSGAVPVNLSVVGLPTTDAVYAVYKTSRHIFGRFTAFPSNIWFTDADLLATQGISLTTYSSSGRVVPAGGTFLYFDPLRSMVLVAVTTIYTNGCIGQSYPDLYITVYKDTSRKTPVTASTYIISNALNAVVSATTVNTAIQNAVTLHPAGTIVYVNGWMYDPLHVPILNIGDVVEIVSDPDIAGYCDITVDDNVTGYYSNLYQEYREILHIPKVLNPNNIVITVDTLTMGVFDSNTNRGVYGHRVDPHAIESITHNDVSVGRSALQAFQTALGALSVKVRLYVRFATRPLSLSSDINKISDLYTLSDSDIKAQLGNLSSHQVPEWNAANLEQSPYLDLLYNFSHFDNADILTNYASAMGYYNVAQTLSQSIHYYTYVGAEVEIRKPKRLLGYPCQIIVYANGRKVPDAYIGYRDVSSTVFTLGFVAGGYVSIGARICVYITEGGQRSPTPFSPSVATPSITLGSDDYSLVKLISYQAPQSVWGGTTTTGYSSIPVSPGDYRVVVNANGTATYTFNPVHYGDSFYLFPKCGLATAVYPLDTLITNKAPIILSLKTSDVNGVLIPQIAQDVIEVYLNGYRLIENIDYTCNPVMGPNNDILQTLLEVSNNDYLNIGASGNILETVIHADVPVSVDAGYIVSNLMYRHNPIMVWDASCGRSYARGLLQEKVTETGNVLTIQQPVPDGSVYMAEWSLPYSVAKLMAGLSPIPDQVLRTRIFNVLNMTVPVYPSLVSVSHLHALYSPFLAAIISDVANGNFTIIDEPKDDAFLKQFASYQILSLRDPVIGAANPLIDRRFVTIGAHYTNFTVTDPTQMLLVQRLITLVLTPSEFSINEVLI